MLKKRAILPFAIGLLDVAGVATGQSSDRAEALAKALASPKTYDLDPAEWLDGIWSDPVNKGEIEREYFVNKRHTHANNVVLVWVYIEILFYGSPAKLERQHWRISCAEETAGVDTAIDADGTTHVTKIPAMIPIPPDSAAKLVMEKVCSKK